MKHIKLLEVYALAGELVDNGRLQPRVAMAAQIPPPPVIGVDEHDVGFASLLRAQFREQGQKGGKLKKSLHGSLLRDRHELSWSECTPKGLDEHSLERPSTDSSYRLDIPLEFEPKGLGS